MGMIGYLDFVIIPVFAHLERVMPSTLKALLHIIEYRGRLVQLAARQVDGEATVKDAEAQTDFMLSNAGIQTGDQLDTRIRAILVKAADDFLLLKSTHVKTATVAQMRNATWEGGIDFDTSSSEEEDEDGEEEGKDPSQQGASRDSITKHRPRRLSLSMAVSPVEKAKDMSISEKLAERRKNRAHLSVGGLKMS